MDQGLALDVYFQTLLVDNITTREIVAESSAKQNSETQAINKKDAFDEQSSVRVGAKNGSDRKDNQHSDFLALFFKVNNLPLATPLQDLSRTIDLPEEIGQLPNQPAMVIGYIQNQGDQVVLLDTPFLFKRDVRKIKQQHDTSSYKKALIIRNSHWGIVCDEVSAVVKLEFNEIQWRRSKVDKPWLLGIATDQLRSLIDLNRLIAHQSFI